MSFSKTREMRCLSIDFAENTLTNVTYTFAAKSNHWITSHIFNIDFVISLGTNIIGIIIDIFIWLQKLL